MVVVADQDEKMGKLMELVCHSNTAVSGLFYAQKQPESFHTLISTDAYCSHGLSLRKLRFAVLRFDLH
jgi:hypothetical protein